MVEAELAEGDTGQILQAIQSALQPPTPVQRVAAPVQRVPAPAPTSTIIDEPQQVDGEVILEEAAEVVDEAPAPTRSRGPRKAAPTPKVIDIDVNSEPTLASFVKKPNPQSHNLRFLVIAAWLQKHRSIDAITVDHIYTCYRSLGWPTNIPDFSAPLRSLKHKQLFTSPEQGKYVINHLGLDRVVKLSVGGE
jgi:hypothetical protein